MLAPALRLAAFLLLTLAVSTPSLAQFPSWGGLFGGGDTETASVAPDQKPGAPVWWKKHKKKAVFVPGEGYQVPGFAGFYDSKGRPINAPVDEIGVKLTQDIDTGGGLIPGIDPKRTVARVKNAIGKGPNQIQAEQFLQEGVGRFQAGNYGSAVNSFETAAGRWPGSDIEAKAMFNKSEALFFDKKYQAAGDSYIALLDKHPSTPRLNDSIERLWSIAQYWERLHFESPSSMPMDLNFTERTKPLTDTIGHSLRFYEAIRLNDPTGPRADDAIMATAGIHFRRENYHDADYHYGLLRREYPRSPLQFEAHLLGLQSKLRKYQGAEYDGTPIDEAKKLEEKVRLTFSGRLNEEEKTRLRDVRAQLTASVEERDLKMVTYYEGTSHYGAASVYLAKIIEDYPESPAAEQARVRLAEIGGKPAIPPTRMSWLVDMVPESKRQEKLDAIVELTPNGLNPDAGVTRVAEETSSDTQTK